MIRVLVADDNAVVRSGLTSLLAMEDDLEVVAEAADGVEAVALARSERPDVVLLDVQMPRMDGILAAAELRDLTRVLMLTYADDAERVTSALRAGAHGYLVHGQFTPEQLATAVRDVAAGGNVVSGSAAAVLVETVRRVPRPTDPVESFGVTRREAEIMALVVEGKTNAAIAEVLFLSEKTVKNHLNRIYAKLGTATRGEAIALWLGAISREPH